jgi:hypothetical protein
LVDNSVEERRREVFKAYLEFYKHMATLSTATAVLLVALHTDVGVAGNLTVITLLSLGISLMSSVFGILDAAEQIGLGPEDTDRRENPTEGTGGRIYSNGSAWAFFFGVSWYAISVLFLTGG